jgi:hypothetical protein
LAEIPILGRERLNEREAFTNLLEALRVAETSAKQLAYLRNQKAWLQVEFSLGSVRKLSTKLAQASSAGLIR